MKGIVGIIATAFIAANIASAAETIKEGAGIGEFAVGADLAALTKAVGEGTSWIQWPAKHVDCLMDKNGRAIELRFNEGFEGETSKGIGIGSSEREVRKAYGKPSRVDDKKAGTKKIEYTDQGILFWINNNLVTQIVVFKAAK